MTKSEGKRVLVTGGAGFIGSHVAESLCGDGWQVEVLDNLTMGDPHNVGPGIPLHFGDIRSEADLRAVFARGRFDAVVHCAAQTSVERSMRDPALDWEINVQGTRLLVEAAQAAGAGRFIFLSSGGAIYGETGAPAVESALPAPMSFYGLHKYAAEQIVRTAGLSHAILRPANVYGPRQRSDAEGGVIAVYIERLLADEPLDIHGDGAQVRDFVHVSDVVAAVKAALATGADVTWNVASGRATRISELVRALADLIGPLPGVSYQARRAGDVDQSLMSNASLLATGLWGPPLALADGLRQTIAASRGRVIADAAGGHP